MLEAVRIAVLAVPAAEVLSMVPLTVPQVPVEVRALGPAGPPGPVGPPGIPTGFGQITYTERTLEPSDTFAANARGQVLFTPTTTQDLLNPPFHGHGFWVGNRVRARAAGDLYDLQVNLIVRADVAGGELRMDADVGSDLGPIASDSQVLFNGALTLERVTFRLRVQVLANFLANGCALYLTSSVPITTVSETVLVVPTSIQAGP